MVEKLQMEMMQAGAAGAAACLEHKDEVIAELRQQLAELNTRLTWYQEQDALLRTQLELSQEQVKSLTEEVAAAVEFMESI